MISLRRVNDRILREFGDAGAETVRRYFAQIEYTAYWCIRMLRGSGDIHAVIPETVEDVVLAIGDQYDLQQIKTRQENQPPWTWADLIPVLQSLYLRAAAFSLAPRFTFCSNHAADGRPPTGRYRTLRMSVYRFKVLLDARLDGDDLSTSEKLELENLLAILSPEVASGINGVNPVEVRKFICATRIETRSEKLRGPEASWDFHAGNLQELAEAIYSLDDRSPTMAEVRSTYARIVLLILKKIVIGRGLAERQITRDEVVGCRTSGTAASAPDLSLLPGDTPLHKKALLGGFDGTETETFRRQRMLAESDIREADPLGEGPDVERLTVHLLDLQHQIRDETARVERKVPVGPQVLRRFRAELPVVKSSFAGSISRLSDAFCLGLLWRETDNCTAWWHAFGDLGDVD